MPLMRLLLAALLALPGPLAASDPVPAPDDPFSAGCLFDRPLCARAQDWSRDVGAAGGRMLLGPRPTQEELARLRQRLFDFSRDLEVAAHAKKRTTAEAYAAFDRPLSPRWDSLRWMIQVAASRDLTAVDRGLNGLDAKLSALEKDAAGVRPGADPEAVDPLRRRLDAASAEGGELWRRVEAVSRNVDGVGVKIEGAAGPDAGFVERLSAEGRLTERINPFQTRVAALARRTQELALRLGVAPPALVGGKAKAALDSLPGRLGDPFAAGPAPGGPAEAAAGGGGAAAPAPGAPRAPTLLDIRRAPAPAGRSWPADRPLFTGRSGRDAAPEETAAVEALRHAGKTATVGDPSGRAAYAFKQTGETCALAASAQVLAEIDGVPPTAKNMARLEGQLYDAAVKKGFFAGDGGDPDMRFKGTTPGQYVGALLGVPVRRTYLATEDQLDAAVKTGKMLIVATNTGTLWNDPRFANGGHIVVVTGAEVKKDGGGVLGYYINDTGTNEGGRFIPRAQFVSAWNGNGRLLLEPQ